ncbi:ABC transporter ATP-binding protein [Bacillaceae bacterium]
MMEAKIAAGGNVLPHRSTQRNVIEVKEVSKTFSTDKNGEIKVLNQISLEVKEKEFLSIVGPSGCGKSTLFNIIAGLIPPTRGKVKVHGKEISQATGHVGYMMQQDLLFPWRTVLENVCLGLEIQGLPKKEQHEKAKEYLCRYGLESFVNAYPSALSGGMRQRVALIRTLVTNPDIILLDEPFSALDFQTRLVLEEEILSILRNEGKTAILITHDIGEAIAVSDRIVVLSKRPTIVKNVYEIGLARIHGSGLKARSDPQFNEYFQMIWDELDIQIGRDT